LGGVEFTREPSVTPSGSWEMRIPRGRFIREKIVIIKQCSSRSFGEGEDIPSE